MRKLEYLANGTDTVLDGPDEQLDENGRPLDPAVYQHGPGSPAAYRVPSPVEFSDIPSAREYDYGDPTGALDPAEYRDPSLPPAAYQDLSDSGQFLGSDDGALQPEERPHSRTPRLDAQESILSQMPQRTQPKWYQRLGAAALGGAVGWSNAAGRARPIDDTQAIDNILHPGYQSKLADWKSRLSSAQGQAEIEATRTGMDQKERKLQSDIAYQKAHGDYMEGIGRSTMVTVTPEMEAATGHRYKAGTKIPASLASQLEQIEAGKFTKAEKTMAVTDEILAKRLGVKPGTLVPYSIYQSGVNANSHEEMNEFVLRRKAAEGDVAATAAVKTMDDERARTARLSRNPPDPLAAEIRKEREERQANKELDDIGQKKITDENRIIQQRSQAIAALSSANRVPMSAEGKAIELRRINEQAAGQLRNVMGEYVQKGRRRGIEVDDYDISVDDKGDIRYTRKEPTSTGQVAPPPQAPAQAPVAAPLQAQFSEAELRAAAANAGKDPDAAVALARAKKLLK